MTLNLIVKNILKSEKPSDIHIGQLLSLYKIKWNNYPSWI